MSYPSYEQWYASLSSGEREKADALLSKLRTLGAARPEDWVRSEVSEDIPQLIRFLVLRTIWPGLVDSWTRDPERWTGQFIEKAERNPKDYFADAGLALKRLKASGASAADIAAVARMVAYETAFGVLDLIDTGYDPEYDPDAPFDGPGWSLMEVNADGELTGRRVGGLHEDFLSMDPSGREGCPPE